MEITIKKAELSDAESFAKINEVIWEYYCHQEHN